MEKTAALQPSKLIGFVDNKNEFLVHFLEGQKLIADLILSYQLKNHGVQFFRDLVLSFMPIISFLKPREGFGLYIDSEAPFFRFKLECNSLGNFRTLILPKDFNDFPKKINGVCRLSKLLDKENSYTSLIELKDQNIEDLSNVILNKSYQVQANVLLSHSSDQALLIMKLPPIGNVRREQLSLKEYLMNRQKDFYSIFNKSLSDIELLKNEFQQIDFSYLTYKEMTFHCPCSKERMVENILLLKNIKTEEIFEHNKNSFDVTCDYCLKVYSVTKSDLNL